MCGIIGFNWDDRKLVRRMASLIRYRGPDQEGFYNDEHISLGNRRLKIVDLSEKGKQPIVNENGNMLIVFNGEIFNHADIRMGLEAKGHRFKSRTDTETVLHAYEEYGPDCLERLNGFFALAIYDSDRKSLFLARDRLGLKPLYYYFSGGKFIFASEVKSILETGIERRLNRTSMERFLAFGYNYGPETMLEGVRKLMPGHYMAFDLEQKRLAIKKYWDISPKPDHSMPESRFMGFLETLLMDSVEKRMTAEVPVGAYLSGGIDSSTIASIMEETRKNIGGKAVRTYCVGFGRSDDELEPARLVAGHIGTDHTEFMVTPDMAKVLPKIVWHSDDPIGDPAFIPIYLLTEKVRPKATVVLTGDGGDEFFAGYEQVKLLTNIHRMKFVPRPLRSGAAKAGLRLLPNKALDLLFKHASAIGEAGKRRAESIITHTDDGARAYVEFCSMFNEQESRALLLRKTHSVTDELREGFFSKGNYFDQILLADIKNQLPEAFCMKNDKMTMAHSVEMRTPFLDHRIAELSFRMPHSLKLRGGTEKYPLRRILQHYVPKEISGRKKQRFYVPIDDWLAGDLKPTVENMLSEKRLKKQGLFDYRYVERVNRLYKSSPLFYARQLWNLITFQIWHDIFILGESHERRHDSAACL
jgi:asparagine synthase (glutamine-hydrolysing)